jgi:amino acid adenylation domain-containing protein
VDLALHDRFLRGLAQSPDQPALRAGAGDITYSALHEMALMWAGALAVQADGGPGAVGILASKGVHAYAGILAVLYAGGTAVPVNPMFPSARIRQMLELAGASAVIAADADEASSALNGLDLPVLTPPDRGGSMLPRAADQLAAPLSAAGADVAYILFTSGSTGRPKGVRITHGSTAHYFGLLDERYDFGPRDVFSQTFDLNFDCAMFDLFCAWGAGAAVRVVPPDAYRELPEFLAGHGVTVWFSTPSAISVLRRMGGLAPGALPGLRWSFFAGEALRCSDTEDWHAAAPNSVIENLYGPTELTITVSGHRWSPLSRELAVNGLVPIGRVHPGHDCLLLAPDGEMAGAEGELCISGPQLTPGYLDPADDIGRFLNRGGRKFYRTGDRVRQLDNDELAYVGRLDAQVQVQGWRVELAEVDQAVRDCHGVEDAVTVARETPAGTELVVFYTGTPSRPAELVRQLRRTLPHGLVPREFRHVREFPLNSNRKIDRRELTSAAVAPRQ